MKGKFFVWLIPDEHSYDYFLSLISDFSKLLEGPMFLPHVTLCSSTDQRIFDLSISRLSFQVEKPSHSDAFFQSIYLPVISETLEDLRKKIETESINIPLQPHLSLFYGTLPSSIRHDICTNVDLKYEHCQLTKKVLVYGDTSQYASSVRGWQIVKTEVLKEN